MNELEIVFDPADAENADHVVCRRLTSPLLMPDNVIDLCSKCKEAIQHRPHIPKRPALICDECVKPLLEAAAAKGELRTMITPKTAIEVGEFYYKKSLN